MSAELLILVLVFLAAGGVTAAVVALFLPNPLGERLQQAAGADGSSPPPAPEDAWQSKLAAALAPAGKLTLPSEGWENSPLRQRFMHAGFRGESAPLVFFGLKTVLTFALPLVFMLGAGISGSALGFNTTLIGIVWLAAVGYYLPNVVLGRRIAARQRELFEALPDAIDLMTVSVEAGLGLDAAMRRPRTTLGR